MIRRDLHQANRERRVKDNTKQGIGELKDKQIDKDQKNKYTWRLNE